MTSSSNSGKLFETREQGLGGISAEFARVEFGGYKTISLPVLAANALAVGLSTPSLDYLAGLSSLTESDTTQWLFVRAASELGLPDGGTPAGRAAIARLILRLMLDGRLSPLEGGTLLRGNRRRNYSTDDWPEYLEIEGLAAEWDDLPDQRPAIENGILEVARSILKS